MPRYSTNPKIVNIAHYNVTTSEGASNTEDHGNSAPRKKPRSLISSFFELPINESQTDEAGPSNAHSDSNESDRAEGRFSVSPEVFSVSVSDDESRETGATSIDSDMEKGIRMRSGKYKWLLSLGGAKVSCQLCRDTGSTNNWAKGVTVPNADSRTFLAHQNSKAHSQSLLKRKGRRDMATAINKMTDKSLADIVRNLRALLFVLQKEKPLSMVSDVLQFNAVCYSAIHPDQQLPLHHRSSFSMSALLSALNAVVKKNQLDDLRRASAITLHIDESTDLSSCKLLLLYIQYVILDASDGVRRVILRPCEFLACLKLTACDAKSIFERIKHYFDDCKIDLSKLVMFTSDGASVMLGANNGVAARLRNEVPHLLDYHCICHVEALGAADCFQQPENRFWARLEVNIRELIHLLSTNKHHSGLEKLAEKLGVKFSHPDRIHEIRWLSRYDAVSKIVNNLPMLVKYLAEAAEPLAWEASNGREPSAHAAKLLALNHWLSAYQTLLCLCHLCDILEPMSKLISRSQRRDLHPFEVNGMVNHATSSLLMRYPDDDDPIVPGDAVSKLMKSVFLESSDPNSIDLSGSDYEAKDATEHFVEDKAKALATSFVRCIESRVSRPQNFRPLCWYGHDSIDLLADQYLDFLSIEDASQLHQEFDLAKTIHFGPNALSWKEYMVAVATDVETFPTFGSLCAVILAFNAQNAEVERGFHFTKRIKTKVRNRLSPLTQDLIMRTTLNTDSWEEFDYGPVARHWMSESTRGRYGLGLPVGPPGRPAANVHIQQTAEVVDDENEHDSYWSTEDTNSLMHFCSA